MFDLNVLKEAKTRIVEKSSRLRVKIISIDGHGGAGKTSFANELSRQLNDCPIVHTDDFASWENPVNWFPRLIEQVLIPLSDGGNAKYQKYDWEKKRLTDWINLNPTEFLILEGVSSSRREFRDFLLFSIFVKTDRDLCLKRGLLRDGEEAQSKWIEWMKEEDEYMNRDNPESYADLIISGEKTN